MQAAPKAPTPLNAALKAAKPAILIAAFFSLFINVLALVSPLYMLQIYDRVLSSRNVTTLLFLTLIAIFLFIVYGLLEGLRTQVLVRGGIRFEKSLRAKIFATVLSGALGSRAGAEVQAFRDADTVRDFLTGSGLIAFCDAPWVPVFVLACFVLHPVFGYLAIASGVVIFLLAIANEFATKRALGLANQAAISAQNNVTATMRNAEVMRAMGMISGLQDRWSKRRDDQIAWQAVASDRGGGIMAGIKFFRQVVQTLILGIGAYLAIPGEISPGAMIAASILVGRALAPIEQAVGSWKSFVAMRGSWGRMQGMFRAVGEMPERMRLPPPKGALEFENVMVGAPGGQQLILKAVSLAIKPGEAVAVIGPSASGKSSFVRAMVGVWPAAQGTIRFDGSDLKHWDSEELGQYIGYLPQDVELFSGSIAENIARFREVDEKEVIAAAQLSGVHELIQNLPGGYNTQIGEGGSTLSGGQRQRVALARAVYGRPPYVVLDEPNANLDSTGEAELLACVHKLKELGSTVIFVTHKTNMLACADKILVLQQGIVQAFGDRDEILAKLYGGPRVVANPPAQQVAAQAQG